MNKLITFKSTTSASHGFYFCCFCHIFLLKIYNPYMQIYITVIYNLSASKVRAEDQMIQREGGKNVRVKRGMLKERCEFFG